MPATASALYRPRLAQAVPGRLSAALWRATAQAVCGGSAFSRRRCRPTSASEAPSHSSCQCLSVPVAPWGRAARGRGMGPRSRCQWSRWPNLNFKFKFISSSQTRRSPPDRTQPEAPSRTPTVPVTSKSSEPAETQAQARRTRTQTRQARAAASLRQCQPDLNVSGPGSAS